MSRCSFCSFVPDGLLLPGFDDAFRNEPSLFAEAEERLTVLSDEDVLEEMAALSAPPLSFGLHPEQITAKNSSTKINVLLYALLIENTSKQ